MILFDGSSGSSWFADALDRHAEVFIAGYEPLEWIRHPGWEGPNATSWQSEWLAHIWGGHPSTSAEFEPWLNSYMLNSKLDPAVHQKAPLTVRTPLPAEVLGARAVGFKVRPATILTNRLGATLRDALLAMGGKVVVINRRNRVEQAISLYRRRVQGKGQFLNAADANSSSSVDPHELAVLLRKREEQAKGHVHMISESVLRTFRASDPARAVPNSGQHSAVASWVTAQTVF